MTLAEISNLVAGACQTAFDLEAVEAPLEPTEAKFGDYTASVAFGLAKTLKKAPDEIAATIVAALKHPMIAKAEAVGGFVNLTLAPSFWTERLAEVNDQYGSDQPVKSRKIQVEFISANPTGPLTIGNARGGYIGDTLARLLEFAGHQVVREYYFNDAGVQIDKLVESVKAAAGLIKVKAEDLQYKGDYIEKLAKEFKSDLETKSDNELKDLISGAIIEQYIKPAIERMGIKFDVWFNERGLVTGGKTAEALERLRKEKLVYEKDGAVWLKMSDLGRDRDRVLVKSNAAADLTYLVNDIPYHINILEERDFDVSIKILGSDHDAQAGDLKAIMQKLFPDKQLDTLIYQWVKLIRNGKEVKISKRAGTYVTTDELLDEVGPGVARFFFLMRSPDTHMEFDLDLAKEESQKNPYWYVMYSYARANSILKKAKSKKLLPGDELPYPENEELALIKQMTLWPELVGEMLSDYGIHRLTFYGLELARRFHEFYEAKQIVGLPKAEAAAKLYLVQQYIQLMQLYFRVLGIDPVSKM